MKMKKAFKPSPVPINAMVVPQGYAKGGGLPTIKEMMKPLVEPFVLIKSRQAGAR
jgi:hypothetical protein